MDSSPDRPNRRHSAAIQRTEPNLKLIWVLVIVLAPLIGAIVYFAIGRQQGSRS